MTARPKKTGVSAPVAEIGLLIYPDCQLSAIYGMTDLFRIASEWAGGREIRVSHWVATDETVTCTWDSHPDLPHRLSHAIAPPSLVLPERMEPFPAAAAWLHCRSPTSVRPPRSP